MLAQMSSQYKPTNIPLQPAFEKVYGYKQQISTHYPAKQLTAKRSPIIQTILALAIQSAARLCS
jgi:hypothetical protein